MNAPNMGSTLEELHTAWSGFFSSSGSVALSSCVFVDSLNLTDMREAGLGKEKRSHSHAQVEAPATSPPLIMCHLHAKCKNSPMKDQDAGETGGQEVADRQVVFSRSPFQPQLWETSNSSRYVSPADIVRISTATHSLRGSDIGLKYAALELLYITSGSRLSSGTPSPPRFFTQGGG